MRSKKTKPRCFKEGSLETFRNEILASFAKKFPAYRAAVGKTGALNSVLLIATDPNVAALPSYRDGFVHAFRSAPEATAALLHFAVQKIRARAKSKRGWAYLFLSGTGFTDTRVELAHWKTKDTLANVALSVGLKRKVLRNAQEQIDRELRAAKNA